MMVTHELYRPHQSHVEKIPEMIVADSHMDFVHRVSAIRELRVRQARRDFNAFAEYAFAHGQGQSYEQQWFHEDWAAAMSAQDRLLIIAPRDHGKTGQMVPRIIWELGRNPELRIKIACASDGRAKERLFEIVQHIENNALLHDVFPRLRPDKNAEWSKHKIHVVRQSRHRDASVEAIGITATATGGRCDLLIADDVVDRRNALSFPALREQIKQAWKSDWTNLLEPQSRVWAICTLWHKDDLNHVLMGNPVYHTIRYEVGRNFETLWPEKWPSSELRKRFEEIGSVEFNRGFRNQVSDDDSAIVREQWVRYRDLSKDATFRERLNAGHLTWFTSYDTAGSPTGKSDQDSSACCVIAVDAEQRRIYVIDAWSARLSLATMAAQVIKEYRKYAPMRILIEKVGQASLDEWVLNMEPSLAGVIEVTKPRVSKAQRLLAVTSLMERGEVIFWKTLNSEESDWQPGRGNLMNDLLDFPFGKHDDLVDAFSQALDAARRYFLDAWATGGEDEIRLTVGAEDGGYLL